MPNGFCSFSSSLSPAQQRLFLGKDWKQPAGYRNWKEKWIGMTLCHIVEWVTADMKMLCLRAQWSRPVFYFIVCSCLVESLALQIGEWAAFLANLALCQLLVLVIICALCLSDGHMHVMNRQLFSIKIIPSSSGLLSAKLHLCPTELHASRQLAEWGPKAGILIVSRESTS